jgi:hypothetical protein
MIGRGDGKGNDGQSPIDGQRSPTTVESRVRLITYANDFLNDGLKEKKWE